MKRNYIAIFGFALGVLSASAQAAFHVKPGFPRLLGMNIGAKNYQDPVYLKKLAKLDVVILGFYPGWNPDHVSDPMRRVVARLKALNPNILVGQYTILEQAYDNLTYNVADRDIYRKLYKEHWWLRSAAGHKVHWNPRSRAWEVNITKWAKPDRHGWRYPDWLAHRNYRRYFSRAPFDIWYFDDVNAYPKIGAADWELNGRNQREGDPVVARAYRQANAIEWKVAHELDPHVLLMGNVDNSLSDPEYKGKLGGAFLEGLMGYSWSIVPRPGWRAMMRDYRDALADLGLGRLIGYTWAAASPRGWAAMMRRYRAVLANTASPHLVGFNVAGPPKDYRFFRFAYASCLLDNGYFSYTNINKGYSSVPWFDEYNIKLGRAVDPPPLSANQNGVFERRFEYGMVLVNPSYSTVTVRVPPGYSRFLGRQDPLVNNGRPAHQITLEGRDGIVLVKDGA